MQRMWTLQEGAAKNYKIMFADANVGSFILAHDRFTRPDQPIARLGFFFDLLALMRYAGTGSEWKNDGFEWRSGDILEIFSKACTRFTRIWNGLAWRSSTKTSDQPIILAALAFGRFETQN